jgi:hypothetical protein
MPPLSAERAEVAYATEEEIRSVVPDEGSKDIIIPGACVTKELIAAPGCADVCLRVCY